MACAPRCGVEPAGACLIAVVCGHRLRHGTGWAGSYLVCSEVCMVGSTQPTWKEVERALVGVQKRGMSENGPWVMAHSRDTPDTNWASHLGPPLCSSCHTPQLSKIKQAHIPLQRGGVCVGGWLQLGARWVKVVVGENHTKLCRCVTQSHWLVNARIPVKPVKPKSNPCHGYRLSEGYKLTSCTHIRSHP